jgi:cholesterol transport system auxiliary component
VLGFAVSGCAGGGANSPAYDIAAAQSFPRHAKTARGQMVIAEPTGISVLDSDKIMVRPSPEEAATLGGAQWQERLPKLLQARIAQSFENSHRLRAVGRPGDNMASDYVLLTDIRSFEIAVSKSTAEIEIAAKIVRAGSGRVVAARVFHVSVPAETTEGPAAIAALNAAFQKLAVDLVVWSSRLV